MPLLATLVLLQTAWKPYSLTPTLRVDLPSAPKKMKVEDMVPGQQIWLAEHPSAAIVASEFSVGSDGTPPDQILAAGLSALLDPGSRLTAQRDIVLNGWPGVEHRMADADGTFSVGRTYVVKSRMVQLLLTGGSAKSIEAPAAKLFTSLRLPGVGKGPQAVAGPTFRAVKLDQTGVTVEMPSAPKRDEVPMRKEGQKMTRFVANYGNRSYLAAYVDAPADNALDLVEATPDQRRLLLEGLNDQVVVAFGGKGERATPATLAGQDSVRTTFRIGDNQAVGRVETTLIGNRAITLLSLVPAPLANSAEVSRFFGSFKAPTK